MGNTRNFNSIPIPNIFRSSNDGIEYDTEYWESLNPIPQSNTIHIDNVSSKNQYSLIFINLIAQLLQRLSINYYLFLEKK